LQTQLELNRQQSNNLNQLILNEKNQKISSLNGLIANLPSQSPQEVANKRIFELSAKEISTALNASELAEIRTIANKCYDSLGVVTLDAQAMLPILEHLAMIDDGEKGHHCNVPRSIESTNSRPEESIAIYPNPNMGDFIHLTISKYGKDFDRFEIYDAFGKSVISQKIETKLGSNQDILIDISTLSTGWFVLQLYDDDNKFAPVSKKFFITK
jgi:Secretion system C-terminal sorting domain